MIGEVVGCSLTEHLYESANSLVYRGRRGPNDRPAIIKILKEDYPTPAELTRYRQEYEITHSLNLEGVIQTYGLEPYQRTLAIVLEDFGGQSLKDCFKGHAVPLEKFLDLAVQIVKTLGQIHSRNVIHKDINPSNIIVNPATGQLKIIDFGISTQLSRENPTLKNPRVLEGTLAYISPEQTGRMNRALDYRTDFYSLGVTFYELLTGQLPFPTTDALELVHCHIAQQPVPPHQINPALPQALSDLVLKLMAKTAEDRYQNAFGLQTDLETCREQFLATGAITPFALGTQDLSGRFQIPQKLYGRELEITTLLAAFERVNQPHSSSELMLVAGYSGIGKSSLVAEVHKPITEKRGYFIAGKYDQFQKDVPYSAVIAAFRSLAKQLLTESESQLEQWRQRLLAALGPNGQVVVDVIPEMSLITGLQPPVTELGPTESQNRFNLVFQNFIRVFCDPNHPLVLFLDDLQWADSASLRLMQLMMTDSEMRSLLVIGAYRDNEVSPTHPLMTLLGHFQRQSVTVNTITLAPLSQAHLSQLMTDTLQHTTVELVPLVELVLQKTEGNPFFVNEFLKSLHAEDLLRFNETSRLWEWDMAQIQAQDLTDNVIELLIGKLQKLSLDTQESLRLAACVGAQFDLVTLAIIRQASEQIVFADLKPAIQLGLIIPLSDLTAELTMERFRFGHDRIQQAAYTLIAPDQKAEVHLRIGRLLRDNVSSDALAERIFEVVDHFNQALDLISEESERQQLAQLNLQAGEKAKSATAYQAAVNYLLIGVGLLGNDGWKQCYELALNLHEAASEAAYLNQDYDRQEQLTEVILQEARCILDTVKVYRVKILARSSQNRHLEATDIGFEILGQLGIHFPEPTPENLQLKLQQTQALQTQRSIESLIDLPAMADPEKLAAMQILSDILSSGYQAAFGRFILSNLTQIQLSLEHGNTAASAFAYDCYGITLCGAVGDIASGYKFGRLALQVVEKFHANQSKSRVIFVFNAFVRHWQDPLSMTIPDLHNGYQIGLETGDVEYACYSLCWESMHSLLTGQDLVPLAARMAEFNGAIAALKQAACLLYLKIYQQTVANLRGEATDLSCLNGAFLQEEEVVVESADNKLALAFFYTHKAMLCYLLADYETALHCTELGERYADGMTAAFTVAVLNFYDSLTQLARHDSLSLSQQQIILEQVNANQQKLQQWAKHAPGNHRHKYELVVAEHHRCLGQLSEAGAAYDRAIALASDHNYPQEAALANELAAQFYFSQGREKFAQIYLQEAYYGYFRWGATAKVQQLEQQYPQLSSASISAVPHSLSATITSTAHIGQALDLASVLQASQAIASEIVLDKLLMTLVQILVRNAGAQVGHLMLNQKDQLLIEASADTESERYSVLQSHSPEGQVPQTLINYVLRTQESVVLHYASQSGDFIQDPYIKANQSQSVLCAPLLNQGQLSGIIYLENNLTTGAFTPDRLELLQLLSGQAAIAIDNARLYNNLEQKVNERTQTLSQTLQELQLTQQELIQSEKMAALGQLIAGIAHEINTPLGAIGSSIQYITNFLNDNLQSLPSFFRALSLGQEQQFQMLLLRSLQSKTTLTGRDRRQARKQIEQELFAQAVPNAETLASLLLDLNLYDDLDPLLPLLNSPDSESLLKMVRQLTRVHESARDITSASDRAAKIVFALKTYARYDHSGEMMTVNLADGIETVLTLYQNQIKYGVKVIRNFEPIPLVPCYTDELNQVWTNLIHNALQAMDYQGTLEISLQAVSDRVQVSITDSGTGIPLEVQPKIFDPFFTTKPPGEGSGLGLDIVKKIIDKHQGSITFNSEPFRTTFMVSLPMNPIRANNHD
jgi:predicted ATPase/signal transduction histidine kinase/tRNA A-37 threonylcarbamoyl transferase component Bud32